jgi:hypothetical protein
LGYEKVWLPFLNCPRTFSTLKPPSIPIGGGDYRVRFTDEHPDTIRIHAVRNRREAYR